MSQAPAPWIHDTEPARPIWALGSALTLTAAALSQIMSGHLTWFFDLCFIAICALLAYRIAQGDFYAAALMPATLLFGVVLFFAVTSPGTVAHDNDGVVQALVSGLAHHAVGFAGGFGATLAILRWRQINERPA